MHHPPLHTELALKAFEADQKFSTALATFQAQASDHGTTAALLESANAHGFCWLLRPAGSGTTEVVLRHAGGAEEVAQGDEPCPLLMGLLGGGLGPLHPVFVGPAPQAAESEKTMRNVQILSEAPEDPEPAPPEPPAAEVAAESLAAATAGMVFELAEGDPSTPLTDEQKATAVRMVSDLTVPDRKSFAIHYRNAFNIPKEVKSVVGTITELRHLEFIDRFTVEAAGGVAP
jgi:hypothetical protein